MSTPRKLHTRPVASLPPNPPPWVIYPIAQRGRITMIAGEPGTGKSLLTWAALLHNYAQLEFLTFPVLPRARVLYLGMDSPIDDYGPQVKRIAQGVNLPMQRLHGTLHNDPLEPPCLQFSNSKLNLMELAVELETLFSAGFDKTTGDEGFYPIDVLVIDAMRQAHDGDENDTRQMGLVMSVLRKIADRGTAIVVLHHTAKAAKGYSEVYAARGSTTIAGSTDIMLNLSQARRGSRSEHGGVQPVKAIISKGRGPDLPDKFYFDNTYDKDRILLVPRTTQKLGDLTGDWEWPELLKETRLSTRELKAALEAEGWAKNGKLYSKATS